MVTLRMHMAFMALGMIRRKQNISVANYIIVERVLNNIG